MKYFTVDEFNCQYTGENQMDPEFMEKVDKLREYCGFPFVITSGYRSPDHPLEAVKEIPGTHAQGIAADIKITGLGVAGDFIHLDTRGSVPVMWTY
jgi:uncharacterized protein YcbK (DUF882 family)